MIVYLKGWHAVPKARPRVTSRGTYMPAGYQDWKQETAFQMRQQHRQEPMQGHVAVAIDIVARRKPRGDIDNLAGAILDAGNGVLWTDDRQIVALAVVWLTPADELPEGIRLEVREWTRESSRAAR